MNMTIDNIAGSEHLNDGKNSKPDYMVVSEKLDEIRDTKISKVTNFNELFNTLKEIGIIETNKGSLVPPESFINIINNIIAGKADIKTITPDAGLREKVIELLGQEKVH
jgi:hypothetical protein